MAIYTPPMCIHGHNEITCRKCDAEWMGYGKYDTDVEGRPE